MCQSSNAPSGLLYLHQTTEVVHLYIVLALINEMLVIDKSISRPAASELL